VIRNPMLGDPEAAFMSQIQLATRRNPRAFDLAGIRSQRVIQRPPSDRALVERLRADPSVNADGAVARKLPRGVFCREPIDPAIKVHAPAMPRVQAAQGHRRAPDRRVARIDRRRRRSA
jgi:hypothetical protein